MQRSTSILMFMVSLLVLAAACTDPADHEDRFLKLSDIAFTFSEYGTGQKVVTVQSNPGWNAQSEAEC